MSNIEERYIFFRIDSDTTMGDLVSDEGSIFYSYKTSPLAFGIVQLVVEKGGENDTYNLDRILREYDDEELDNYKTNFSYTNMLVKKGTYLSIPESKANIEVVAMLGKNLVLDNHDMKYFMAKAYQVINNDALNFPSTLPDINDTVQLKHYNCAVWVYSRAIGEIIDVTKYVHSLSTSSTMAGGGNFSFSLSGVSDIDEDFVNQSNIENSLFSYFLKNFQMKDIVWLRFEKLELETDNEEDWKTGSYKLHDNVYDMMGVIDNISESTDYITYNRSVNINGRDFTAILEDDEAYFYNVMFTGGSNFLMFDTTDDSPLFKRNCFNSGKFESFFTFEERSIEQSLAFLVNQLSNLGLVRNSLFIDYKTNDTYNSIDDRIGDKRTKALSVVRIGKGGDYMEWHHVEGVWQIIDLFIDSQLKNRMQVDSLLTESNGSILSMARSICQEPLVEFFGDTYADKFVFQARQPIFDQSSILSFKNENFIIEIDQGNVYSEDLSFSDEYYCSYQIDPNMNIFGNKKLVALSFIPVVFLNTIAENFGSKRYMFSDSYIDSAAVIGNNSGYDFDNFWKGVINDFIYVINTTAYLMFSREGVITIDGDRRIKKGTWVRYKKTGELFYVNGVSNDISFSDSSIDRTTVLSVERGMVEDFISGVDIPGVGNVSYFNIIDTKFIKRKIEENIFGVDFFSQATNVLRPKDRNRVSFDVNKEVFRFFAKRRQFDEIS